MSFAISKNSVLKTEPKLRICIDTNIILSAALFPEGKVARVLSYILETHTVIISSYSIKECRTVFKKKFPDKSVCLEEFLEKVEYERFETPLNVNANDFPSIRDKKLLAGSDPSY